MPEHHDNPAPTREALRDVIALSGDEAPLGVIVEGIALRYASQGAPLVMNTVRELERMVADGALERVYRIRVREDQKALEVQSFMDIPDTMETKVSGEMVPVRLSRVEVIYRLSA